MNNPAAQISPNKVYKQVFMFVVLAVISLGIAFLTGHYGAKVGILLFVAISALPIAFAAISNLQFGLYLFIWYSYFLFFIGRLILPFTLPMGVGVELIEIMLLVGILISDIKRSKVDWSLFNNPVSYILLVSEVYSLLQFFNPNAVSLTAWMVSTRGIVFDVVLYFIMVRLLSSLSLIKKYTMFWVFLSFLAAMYGIYQEVFGYSEFEWRAIYSDGHTLGLIQNWGILRKFSFLSDVASFGILMAFSGVFCVVLALMDGFEWRKRVLLGIGGMLMLVSMSFSGTRTATAMVPAGILIFILMNINNRKGLILAALSIVGLVAILFGPFYGGVISRIRTTFQPKNDDSMNVREYNRKRIQPYIYAHPIGGGVYTTDGEGELYSPGHPLAGFPTDSGFLKTALTTGWIGLIINMSFYFMILYIGVTNFYAAKDPQVKALYGAYIALFFSLILGNYAQSAMGQKPIGQIVFSIFAIMPNLIKFDKPAAISEREKPHTTN